MNNFEIKLLGNATSLDAALNSNSADLRYGPINWRLDQISLANPTLDFIDMWTNRIVRCGNFVNAAPYMDAMN